MANEQLNRRKGMANRIIQDGKATVKELAEIFGVSTETIRKDLDYLQQKGLLIKGHGEALLSGPYSEQPIGVKMSERTIQKRKIAKEALAYIPEKCKLFLDPGSTALELARLLWQKEELTIFTNSIAAASILLPSQHEIILLGGRVQRSSESLVGRFAVDQLMDLHFDLAIMGTDGFKGQRGPTTFSYEESLVKKEVLRRSNTKIQIFDESKFDVTGTYTYGKFDDFDVLITNAEGKADAQDLPYANEWKFTEETQ
ncbi:MAG: DeoR/GlpR transcriptional regulator [Erysipelotrichaceae bacterium]|nr:DeoR/GlpR transcriptional regulator [Erysipelotrichaceae bacterium]